MSVSSGVSGRKVTWGQAATSSFNEARQRLPLEPFQMTLRHTAARIAANVQSALSGAER